MIQQTPEPPRPSIPSRVLLVEDDAALREALGELLRGRGFEVVEAACVEQALLALDRRPPFACALSDHDLGRSTGVELFARMRDRWPSTARILLTGRGELDFVAGALRSGGIFRFLRKPCAAAELIEAVAAGCEQYRRVEQSRARTEALAFSREALQGMLDELERRLDDEIASLGEVQALVAELAGAESLERVARLAADAASRLLGGRPARVEIQGALGGPAVAADARARGAPLFAAIAARAGASVLVEDPARLTARDRRILETLLASTTLAAEGARRARERDEAEHATVLALARLAEHRDDETGRHLLRVSEYCRLIALGLSERGAYVEQLTERFVLDLVRSAPLHDIGKVGIPDGVLLKPGKLSPDEWDVMRRHTVIGGDTLRSVIESTARPGFLRVAHDIALRHHEKWDGSGYPGGLAGEAIPLSARIVALADVYDALTTRRPYKEPWTHEDAHALIRRERGRHFDPAVVDAFLAHADDFDAVRRRLPDECAASSAA